MHLTLEALENMLKGELSTAERNEVVRHLLTKCPECMKLARDVAAHHGMVYVSGRFKRKQTKDIEHDTRFDPIFDQPGNRFRDLKERLASERLQAVGQWPRLLKHSQTRCLALIAADPSLRTYGLYEKALDSAREITSVNPALGLVYAEVAIAIAQSLDATLYGESQKTDFVAAALAVRGNCKRVAQDFEDARADLQMAAEDLSRGTGDALEWANILSLQGSWNNDLGYFEEAEKVLTKAINIYKRVGANRLIGLTMVQLGTAIGHVNPEKGVEILDDASAYVSHSDSLTELCLRHNLAWHLTSAGRVQEAIGVLEDSRELYCQFTHHAYQLRLCWLEGRIRRALGNLREAEETFAAVSSHFLANGLTQEYLLCSIDLAESIYAQGDYIRTLRLCHGLYRLLGAINMHEDALGAMRMFTEAIKEGADQTGAFIALALYFRRCWFFHHGNNVR